MDRVLGILVAFIVFSGCARTVLVSAQRDLDYQVNKDAPLFLKLGDDVSVSERNAYTYLRRALERSGFENVEKIDDAKVVMTLSISQEQYLYEGYRTFPDSRMSMGYMGGYYTYPTIYVSERTLIELRLFDAQTFLDGKRLPLWEGSISTEPETLDSRLQECLTILVDRIGVDFRGRVRLEASN